MTFNRVVAYFFQFDVMRFRVVTTLQRENSSSVGDCKHGKNLTPSFSPVKFIC